MPEWVSALYQDLLPGSYDCVDDMVYGEGPEMAMATITALANRLGR